MIISQKLLVSIRTQSFVGIYVKTQTCFKVWNCIFFVVWEWISYVIFVFADSISVSICISDRCRRNWIFCNSLNPRVVGSSTILGTTVAGTFLARRRSYEPCLQDIWGTLLGRDLSHTQTHTCTS